MDPWLIRMVNHPNCRDPGKLYLSHCTVTHSTEEEWWTKRLPLSDLPWHTDPNPSCTEGRNAFFNGPPQNPLSFTSNTNAASSPLIMGIHSTDPGQEKLLSWLAEDSLHVCLSSQVATSPNSFLSDSPQLWARALSYHNQQFSLLGVSAMDQHWLLSFSFFPRMDFLLQHPRFTNYFFCKQLLFGDWAFQKVVTGFFVCLLFNLKQSLSPQPLLATAMPGSCSQSAVVWSWTQDKEWKSLAGKAGISQIRSAVDGEHPHPVGAAQLLGFPASFSACCTRGGYHPSAKLTQLRGWKWWFLSLFPLPTPNCLLAVLAKQNLNNPACNHQQETYNLKPS